MLDNKAHCSRMLPKASCLSERTTGRRQKKKRSTVELTPTAQKTTSAGLGAGAWPMRHYDRAGSAGGGDGRRRTHLESGHAHRVGLAAQVQLGGETLDVHGRVHDGDRLLQVEVLDELLKRLRKCSHGTGGLTRGWQAGEGSARRRRRRQSVYRGELAASRSWASCQPAQSCSDAEEAESSTPDYCTARSHEREGC